MLLDILCTCGDGVCCTQHLNVRMVLIVLKDVFIHEAMDLVIAMTKKKCRMEILSRVAEIEIVFSNHN